MVDELTAITLLNASNNPKKRTLSVTTSANPGREHFDELLRVLNTIKDEGQIPMSISHTPTDSIIIIHDKRGNWEKYY